MLHVVAVVVDVVDVAVVNDVVVECEVVDSSVIVFVVFVGVVLKLAFCWSVFSIAYKKLFVCCCWYC